MKRQIINSSAFFVILAAFMLLVVQSVTYGETTVSMSPSSVVSPAVGGQLTFTISITGGVNVYSYGVDVTFDPTALSYVSIAEGGYIADVAFGGGIRLSDNRVEFVAASTSGTETDGGGTLATVTFRVVAVKDSTIGLSVVLGNRRLQPLDVTARGAEVTRTGGTSTTNTGAVSPEPNPTVFVRVLGHYQSGVVGQPLAKPFVVRIRRGGDPLEGVGVVFKVITGGGSLSDKTVLTDANGRAESTLTLGSEPGTNTVEVSAEGTDQVIIFSAEATLPPVPTTLSIISGENQNGMTGEVLTAPFVVEVRDQYGGPMEGVTVPFTVSAGDGTLSTITAMTDVNGQAEITLTLGSDPGTNTVDVSVEGIAETVTFNAEASLPPPIATTLSVISGDNQTGLTGEALTDPFVVEVRDQYGDLMEGVSVTFAVSAGGGSLSDTTVDTDANGLAQSTLTLGSDPGTNTVTVSVEGIAEIATFNAIAELLEFDLSVPSGYSLIHVPLKVTAVDGIPQIITSIGDLYDALGGVNAVKLLLTLDSQTQEWFAYVSPSDRGTPNDRELTDDMGIFAEMKVPKQVRLTGRPLGTNGSSTITLNPSYNLVGLPLRDSRLTHVSDLFALEGIGGNAPAVFFTDNGELKAVVPGGGSDDIEITGGQAFFFEVQQATTVAISGDGWDNTASGTMAAPPMTMRGIQTTGTTSVLALSGSIVDSMSGINKVGLRVSVKNLSTGSAVTTVVGDAGSTSSRIGYRLTVVDITSGRAAAIGDTLEISVTSPDTSVGVEPLRYTVTAEDVRHSRIELPALFLQEIPTETELLRNYPNPFNPETWIPYRLAEDAFVTLTIYNGSGQVVRTLDIGHQAASVYESRSKAAYWDGRNEVGETVASGLYFYTLTAGDFSATRKMLILK